MNDIDAVEFRVLVVEDSEDDAMLMIRWLRRRGYEPLFERVDNAEGLRSALTEQVWDLILTDHNMPGFSSQEALAVIHDVGLDIPAIIVSGAIGEEHAVAAMKAGARDYVMKDNLARLGPAIERELKAARSRQAKRVAEEAVRHMTYHDALTNLVNRQEFEYRLRRALRSAREQDATHALAYFDLDQFKVLNDACGHMAGDELLRQIGSLLRAHVGPRDTLARLGGDEYGVLFEHANVAHAQRVANKLCDVISEFRFLWGEQVFHPIVSVGLVEINAKTKSLGEVLQAADRACYS
ncbi:MAG: GGDEF domain-containing response regulator, partial [Gammaproteobacteria bacterium]|nr:GGDEF domain-containing response regulator [Gammaproteobacteria bacterium]